MSKHTSRSHTSSNADLVALLRELREVNKVSKRSMTLVRGSGSFLARTNDRPRNRRGVYLHSLDPDINLDISLATIASIPTVKKKFGQGGRFVVKKNPTSSVRLKKS
jgi:hypothetical protein